MLNRDHDYALRIFNEITDKQNNDEENQYLKSMYPKQKSYIPRFALLIHVFDCYFDDKVIHAEIGKESILKAEKLSEYFVNNAKKVKVDSSETSELKNTMKRAETVQEKFKAIYNANPDFNRSKVAELLSVSRSTIYKYIKQMEDKK